MVPALSTMSLSWPPILLVWKTTGLGLGNHMYPAKVSKDGPSPGGKLANLNEVVLDADSFAGVFPEH